MFCLHNTICLMFNVCQLVTAKTYYVNHVVLSQIRLYGHEERKVGKVLSIHETVLILNIAEHATKQ